MMKLQTNHKWWILLCLAMVLSNLIPMADALAAKPNDTLYDEQSYLRHIQAEAAWDEVNQAGSITIAIVDTGVDLTHPDLQGNLVQGINLIERNKPPQDDNGHGTNVAGVIAAIGNNNQGISGLAWGTKIMPVKALEAKGIGDEDKLGEGIRYAVDHGAKIVVLAVGLYRYSEFMKEVVEYAEAKGVLLISASGNDGENVKYPAGYPTVLAVGGVLPNNKVEGKSNYGSELDVVAPWHVYTTSLGGDYMYNEGTSMAAPQVAGVAALIMEKYPQMKPYEVRNLIRQTADDIELKGWDKFSGYGVLRADRALKEAYIPDIYEDNNAQGKAKPLPLESMISAQFDGGADQDWFVIDAPYHGSINLQITQDQANNAANIQLTHYPVNSTTGIEYQDVSSSEVTLQVLKGLNRIKLNLADPKQMNKLNYRMSAQFTVYRDAFENNDRQYKAYVMPPRSQTIKGTFDQLNDQDWFMIPFDNPGTLRIRASTDTKRMDLALSMFKNGDSPLNVDVNYEGEMEITPLIEVAAGDFYIQVRNAISENAYPVVGEYTLEVIYTNKYKDPNEPNNSAIQAGKLLLNTEYIGVFDKVEDEDWFSFTLEKESYVNFDLSHIPKDRIMSFTLHSNVQKQLYIQVNKLGETKLGTKQVLAKGTYFIRLSANQMFQQQMYKLQVTAVEVVGGYTDISAHWAKEMILDLSTRKIVSGYTNHDFLPNANVTRAEAVTMLVKAFNLVNEGISQFRDVSEQHWAYRNIKIARQNGMVSGYDDGTFAPDQAVTRTEMTVMLAQALGLIGTKSGNVPYSDLADNYWAIDTIRQMVTYKWISGYPDGTFRPEGKATRAELVSLIYKVIKSLG